MAKNEETKALAAYEPGGTADLDRLIGRALMDPDFRAKLVEDPKEAAASLGIELNERQIARLSSLNPEALEVVAAAFKQGVGLNAAGLTLW